MRSPAESGAEPRPKTDFWHIFGSQNTSGRQKNAIFCPVSSAKLTYLYDVSDLNVSISGCVKDGEAIIYQGL